MDKMELRINMDNSDEFTWTVTNDMEYDYNDRFFTVKKDGKWVGMYAADHVIAVEVRKWS